MKKRFLIIVIVLLIISISLIVREIGTTDKDETVLEHSVAAATWFSDVSYWDPPSWSVEKGTVTGDITAETGLTLNISIPADNGDSRLSLMLINGNVPDIISITNKNMINHLVKSDKVWKMEDFLKTYAPYSHLRKEFPEDVKEALIKRDGDWFALPSHMESEDNKEIYPASDTYWSHASPYADGLTIIWNKSLLKRIGLTSDKLQTEDQVLAAFQKALDRGLIIDGNKVIPLLIDGTDYQENTLGALQNFFGAELVDENGQYRDKILAPESKHALQFLNTVVQKGYLDSTYFMIDNKRVRDYLDSGRVLCFIGNVSNAGINEQEWYSTAPILSKEGSRPVLGINRQTFCGWISTFVSKECKNPREIAKWLDYMTSEKGMMLSYYGYQNIDYTINSNGFVRATQQGIRDREDYRRTGIGIWWPFFNKDWYFSVTQKPAEDDRDASRYQILCALGEYNRTYLYDSALVEIPVDYIDANSYLGDMDTEISQYKKSQITSVIMAASEAEFEQEYDEMTERLKDIGIDRINSVKNKRFQENCSRLQSSMKKVN
jgi:hypothetical protein